MRIAPFTPGDRVVGITAPPDQAGSRSLFRGDSRTRLIPLQEHVAGSMRTALLVLLGAVGLVLLIGCTNVANLLLARAAARKREMAVRTVLGAARRRIVRQLLVESCLLGLLGGLAGLAVAVWIRSIARSLIPADLQSFHRLELDLPVLLFTLAISLVTGLLFGLAPAWQASRLDLNSALKSGGASAVTSRGHWLRRGLAVGEIGMAMVLLIGAMLLLRSFDRLRSVSPGFDPDGVMTATISLGPMEYREGHRRNTFYREWLAEVQALPGVRFAGLIDHLPLTDYSMMLTLLIENRPPPARGMESPVSFAAVSQEYFAAMGIPIRQGRSFRGAGTTPAEVLINETLARRYFADENPLGRRVAVPGGPDQWATIVGVVGDVRQSGLDRDIVPEVYGSVDANPGWVMSLVVRADGDPTRLAPAIRDAVRRLDSNQALHAVLTMEERLAATLAPRRLNVLLLGSSALLALVMAVVGIYGVLSYLVAQRTREIGIRMALGAGSADVLFLVLREAGALIGCGLLAGMATAFASTGYLASLLYGVPPRDLVTFVVVATILGAVAMTACYLPARRAANVEPLTALRDE